MVTLSDEELVTATGGKTSQSDLQLTKMLTDISSSIKEANDAKAKSATDPMQMMMTMMMLGGGGGAAAAPAPAQPVVEQPQPNVVRVRV
jgi:hypothetical protein